MKIRYIDISEVGELADTYNRQFSHIPNCYAISSDEFVKGFPYHKWSRDWYHEDIHSEKLIICEENGKIIGFGDVAIAETKEKEENYTKGFIRFLTYEVGCRPIGQAILEECESYLTGFDINEIKAFRLKFMNDHCGYHFYHLGYNLLSDKMGHICALLNMNGYKKTGGEIFLSWPEYGIDEPILPSKKIEIVLNQLLPKQADLPGLEVAALLDGKRSGECHSMSSGEFCRAREAQDWVFITGLGIINKEQGKGWGRYLLQRNLWEMQKIGYKNTVISTDWENYRAQLFYANYGYKLVDTGYEFTKNL